MLVLLDWISRLTRTEMSEGGWETMPHCCSQAQCWMHTPNNGSWCACGCSWCRIARRLKRGRATTYRPFHRAGEAGQWRERS